MNLFWDAKSRAEEEIEQEKLKRIEDGGMIWPVWSWITGGKAGVGNLASICFNPSQIQEIFGIECRPLEKATGRGDLRQNIFRRVRQNQSRRKSCGTASSGNGLFFTFTTSFDS